MVHYIWLHWNGFIQYPCDIISSLSGCLLPTAAAEEVLNHCTMKDPNHKAVDRYFSIAFNYEFIEDIQDKYVILYFCLIHTTFRTSMLVHTVHALRKKPSASSNEISNSQKKHSSFGRSLFICEAKLHCKCLSEKCSGSQHQF